MALLPGCIYVPVKGRQKRATLEAVFGTLSTALYLAGQF